MLGNLRLLKFVGTSAKDLRGFPKDVRRNAAYQLDKVVAGDMPDDFKFMRSIGPGAIEIQIDDESGIYRVIYVAKFADAVYVLHGFKKTTQRTDQRDIELARTRYNSVLKQQRSLRGVSDGT